MKKLLALACIAILAASCSHFENFIAKGKYYKAGPLVYVDGLLVSNTVRENSEFVLATSDGDSVGEAGAFRGVKSIGFRTGPSVSGYLVDLAEVSPEAAKAYVEGMGELNQPAWNPVIPEPVEPAAVPKARKPAEKENAPAQAEGFACNGDCTFTDLSSHDDVAWLMGAVTALTAYDGSETMPETGETYAETLKDYAHILSVYADKGRSTCPLVLLAVTVEARKVTYLRYGWRLDDGSVEEVQCPNCTAWELPEMLEESAEQ